MLIFENVHLKCRLQPCFQVSENVPEEVGNNSECGAVKDVNLVDVRYQLCNEQHHQLVQLSWLMLLRLRCQRLLSAPDLRPSSQHTNSDNSFIIVHFYPVPDTSGDTILFSIDLFVCLFVYLYLCLFVSLLLVSKITRKRLDRFAWNFLRRCGVTMGWPDYIFGQFRETARCATRGRGLLCFRTTACLNIFLVSICLSDVSLLHVAYVYLLEWAPALMGISTSGCLHLFLS